MITVGQKGVGSRGCGHRGQGDVVTGVQSQGCSYGAMIMGGDHRGVDHDQRRSNRYGHKESRGCGQGGAITRV